MGRLFCVKALAGCSEIEYNMEKLTRRKAENGGI